MAQSLTVLIAPGRSVQTLSRPRFVFITIRARTRYATCFEIICCESAKGSVNPCTEAGPWERRSIIARRVGSDRAANVVPNLSTTYPQPTYPQPYGSGLSINVKREVCDP